MGGEYCAICLSIHRNLLCVYTCTDTIFSVQAATFSVHVAIFEVFDNLEIGSIVFFATLDWLSCLGSLHRTSSAPFSWNLLLTVCRDDG